MMHVVEVPPATWFALWSLLVLFYLCMVAFQNALAPLAVIWVFLEYVVAVAAYMMHSHFIRILNR
ncbi:unnamed protein product, partial [Chrysoparadoxa australica]